MGKKRNDIVPTPIRAEDLQSEKTDHIFLGQMGCVDIKEAWTKGSMYVSLSDVLELMTLLVWEKEKREIAFFRTVESGAVEEYVVVEVQGFRKNLLFRAWPVFYAREKELRYEIYAEEEDIIDLITFFLGACARANHAHLVAKS
jgi:hypothetical protein